MDRFSLKNRVAVVTGGAGILGQAFCNGLAQAEAKVAVIDIKNEEACEVAEKLKNLYGIDAIGVGCDVASSDSVDNMMSVVLDSFGEVNILLNNAASKSGDLKEFFAPFEEYSLDQWRQVMAVNIDGMFLMAKAVGKQMLSQGKGGSIIQTASIYGVVAPDNRIYEGSEYIGTTINTPAVYSASKAAVIGLTKYLSTYWAEKGIRVNTISPGGVESGQNEAFIEKYSNRVPIGRMGKPQELVGAVLYLASDASSYVTGQNIIIDGGLSVW
jgi:NAD(P)-dependent dehydrogenase (short-subunit alcohol dehydrogenase family)